MYTQAYETNIIINNIVYNSNIWAYIGDIFILFLRQIKQTNIFYNVNEQIQYLH